tara:strand:- start:74 stop:520 length:447 start_codon:yes stop_codon:yes gene_type:complete
MTIEELLLEWKKDSEINKAKLDDESIRSAILHSKYLEMHAAVKIKYHRIKSKLKDLEMSKRKWLKGSMSREEMDERNWDYDPWKGLAKPLKSEMDDYIMVDKDVSSLIDKLKETEIMLETLESILNNVTWRHQHIKNALDFMKFQSGA